MLSDTNIGIFDPNGDLNNPLTDKPYSQTYKSLGKIWSKYPAYNEVLTVLNSINKYQVTFIISGTGSGKTVLIPKFALHYTNYAGKVAVVLPKRDITSAAAIFSAKTLDVTLGEEVGYVHKNSPKDAISSKSRLIYMTDGLLIMKYLNDPYLSEYNVVIIDEAHERKVQIDLLLFFLKNIILSGKRPDLKIIIMSATIDVEKYQEYFDNIPINPIFISGQPNYPITTIFLDHISKNYVQEGLEVLDKIERYDKKDTLFFVTSGNEAFQICKTVRNKFPKIFCVEVYAGMNDKMRFYALNREEYKELGNFDTKVVIATNVAESSLTIDGLQLVIDSGYELYSYYDPDMYASFLEKRLITKAQALQRRGRVGRTEPGICYHLLTQEQFDSLKDYPAPDILKQDITLILLQIIKLTSDKKLDSGINLINQLMDKPYQNYITSAITLYKLYKLVDPQGKITSLGDLVVKVSSLSLNRILFLFYAYDMFCLREAAIIIAMMEKLSGKINMIFVDNQNSQKKNTMSSIISMINKKSDHLTYLQIFQNYKNADDKNTWCNKHNFRIDIFKKIDRLSQQYYQKIIGIKKNPEQSRPTNTNTKQNILNALKTSHQHLIAKGLVPTFPSKKIRADINKDSVINLNYNRKKLENKTFIYDELSSINGKWEFNGISII
jgi:HrpA-like RNA helicase